MHRTGHVGMPFAQTAAKVLPTHRPVILVVGLQILDKWYDWGYTVFMKTAISIPDPIFQRAEDTAKKLGLSRSELYAKAVFRFIKDIGDDSITQRLDKVYTDEPSKLNESLSTMQSQTVFKEQW